MINDIEKVDIEVNNDIDVKSQVQTTKLSIDHKLVLKNTSDIWRKYKNVNLHKKFYIKIYKNRTNNFDALQQKASKYRTKSIVSKNETIDLVWKENIKKSIKSNNLKINISFKSHITIFFNQIIKFIKNKFNLIWKLKKVFIFSKYFLVFFVLFLSYIFISKSLIEYNVNSAYKRLIELKDLWGNKELIKKSIEDSAYNFKIANILFSPFIIIPWKTIEIPKHIIIWWKNIVYSLDNLFKIYEKIDSDIANVWLKNIELTTILQEKKLEFNSINEEIKKALLEYNSIEDLNQDDLNEKFEIWKNYLTYLSNYVWLINDNYQTFLNILWDKQEKKYLIVFQNADEIRPTWWFMWSMWIVYLNKWKITKFVNEDVYSYEWNLKKADYLRLKAPEWINKLTWILWLRDSNYSINTSNSSENIKFFIWKAWFDIDWVVYINNTIIEQFLKNTWNISFTKIWENIRENNFSEIMSLLVESKNYKNGTLWTPKQILFDFIDEFKAKLIKDWNYLEYFKLILSNVEKREIMVYSFSPKENKLLQDLNLNWQVEYKSTLDFNYPIYTSISWNKSDRYVNRSFTKTIMKNNDCSFETSFKVSINHDLDLEDESNLKDYLKKYEIKTPNILQIQGMWDNWQYIKVLLPKNAIIKEDKKYKIEETPQTKAVTFYIKTKRFEKQSVTINYSIPNKNCEAYTYSLYKQPGIRKYDLVFKNDEASIERKNIVKDFIFKK